MIELAVSNYASSPLVSEIDPLAVARACQQVSAHNSADSILDTAARAALALTGAGMCAAEITAADDAPWLALRVGRDGASEPHAGELSADAVRIAIVIDDAPRGYFALEDVHGRPEVIAEALAPLATQLAIGLKQAALYGELEALVIREMQTSVEREAAMQLVLDSMTDGLLVCELDGRPSAIRSKSVTTVFGQPPEDKPLWSYLSPDNDDFALRFEIGWEQTVNDVLPFELAVSQMPTELHRGERTYGLSYERVDRDGALSQIAVSIRDITAELAARRAHELAHELASVIRSLMADREGFFSFLDEVEQLLGDLGKPGIDLGRWIHTIKGNTAMFGFRWFAAQCHQIEDELAAGNDLDEAMLDRMRRGWQQSLEPVKPFLGQRSTDDITVARDELAEQIGRMRDAGVARELLTELERWRFEPVGPALERLARQAERIAAQQGKQLEVVIEGGRLRLADDRMRRLLSPMVHAVRNAIDHGLETPDERTAAGKPATGRLVLACRHTPTELVFSITDDGRGVAWDRVRAKAERLGLPSASRGDLVEALFADGMSTAEAVTDVSGRGVGMGALRETCVGFGGYVRVDSEPGQGTQLTCAVPSVA